MKLSVVVPVYNEVNTLLEILRRVQAVPLEKEIIIVDDFSSDGTREMIAALKENNIKVLFNERNMGKGYSIRKGFEAVTGDVVIIQDADLEYNPEEYQKLLKPILSGLADVVYGSRFISGSEHRVVYFWHSVGNRLITLLSNMFSDINLSDIETCYKVFKSDIIKKIKIEENRFGFEPEITAKIAKTKCRIYEVGISYHGRTYEEGKKIGWIDGFRALYCIVKYNLFR
ncbi:MAG: glycosyltransferase family 2 protein [Elusimicrobia bacterium]|nr:glycosyltransferase family 2 protein [Candidatus Liberimonas magnetica]